MKNLSKEEMMEIINANIELSNALTAVNVARSKVWKLEQEHDEGEWRNTKISYWKDICAKYPENKLLNCYGDIFYIDEVLSNELGERAWIGRRVLWNLGLSEEKYEIYEDADYDFEGNYNYSEYEIKVVTD